VRETTSTASPSRLKLIVVVRLDVYGAPPATAPCVPTHINSTGLRGKRGSDNGSSQPGATARPRALRLPASRAGNAARLNPEGVQLGSSFVCVGRLVIGL
jgi:hypothetical protein